MRGVREGEKRSREAQKTRREAAKNVSHQPVIGVPLDSASAEEAPVNMQEAGTRTYSVILRRGKPHLATGPVIDLMEALKRSMRETQVGRAKDESKHLKKA